ncbi:MAG TPA: peptidylprolyl isomerase, partial [Firmicutes bacterium]|nr:peptidylprolyl isomerase [Bacillota bacterium]
MKGIATICLLILPVIFITPLYAIDYENPKVVIETDKGNIILEVYLLDAPITAGNFLMLVNDGYYDGIIFHRVEPGYVVQGGDPEG